MKITKLHTVSKLEISFGARPPPELIGPSVLHQ